MIRLWRESERLAAELRPAIDAIAEAVMARGQLSYFETAGFAAAATGG
jgi:DNA-binding ferritin-like protein